MLDPRFASLSQKVNRLTPSLVALLLTFCQVYLDLQTSYIFVVSRGLVEVKFKYAKIRARYIQPWDAVDL